MSLSLAIPRPAKGDRSRSLQGVVLVGDTVLFATGITPEDFVPCPSLLRPFAKED